MKYDKSNFEKNDGVGGLVKVYQLCSILSMILAFMFKTKAACWFGMFFLFTSVINAKAEERTRHFLTGFGVLSTSFLNVYYRPKMLRELNKDILPLE